MQVRRGVTRTVILAGRWAVKVPRVARSGRGALWSLAHGVLANLSEVEWSGWPGVCPVRWSLAGIVNVYPRCAAPPEGPLDFAAIAPPGVPADRKRDNVGVLAGRLVWLDYSDDAECVACARYRGGSASG